jgi:hypothetical protein
MKKALKKQHPIDQLQRIYLYSRKRSLKSEILNRLCEELNLHRKSVVRRLNQVDRAKKRRADRKVMYSPEALLSPLKLLAMSPAIIGRMLKSEKISNKKTSVLISS